MVVVVIGPAAAVVDTIFFVIDQPLAGLVGLVQFNGLVQLAKPWVYITTYSTREIGAVADLGTYAYPLSQCYELNRDAHPYFSYPLTTFDTLRRRGCLADSSCRVGRLAIPDFPGRERGPRGACSHTGLVPAPARFDARCTSP